MPPSRRVTPLWLSHHWPEDYDRCVRIGRNHVCRRCLVLYPLAAVATVVGLAIGGDAGLAASNAWSAAIVLLAPLPAVVEFVLEHVGILRHNPRRQVVVTVPLGLGLGVGFARYLGDLADPVFWGTVLLYGGVCLAAAAYRWRRPEDQAEDQAEDRATDGQ